MQPHSIFGHRYLCKSIRFKISNQSLIFPAADYIYTAIDEGETERSSNKGECKILVNCQMGVSRSASCAMAYLMIHKSFTAVEALTLIRKSRDCRPNDGFLSQLIHLDNQLRLEREHSLPRTLKLSTWQVCYLKSHT